MKPTFLIALCFSILTLDLSTQDYAFPCDSNFTHYAADKEYETIAAMRDTINQIDFSQTDLEIRFWTFSAGQLGPLHEAIVLRKQKRDWRIFVYTNFKQMHRIDNLEEIFKTNEITDYDNRSFREQLNTLLDNGVLTLEQPTYDTFSEFLDLRMVSVSHDGRYTIEIISKDCARKYSIPASWLGFNQLQNAPVIIQLNEIKNAFDEIKRLSRLN